MNKNQVIWLNPDVEPLNGKIKIEEDQKDLYCCLIKQARQTLRGNEKLRKIVIKKYGKITLWIQSCFKNFQDHMTYDYDYYEYE